mmetsp:Transcript_13647/g.16931  ORF Transcript_13647/g.16931 Transcript_13647/m.16931 type:complete len:235 (+) Transcript_13647:395-1099(+)
MFVKVGLLYRSSMAFSQDSLANNGIKTVIDLRKKGTEPLFEHETSTRHHIPMVGSKAGLALLRSLPTSVLMKLILTCFKDVETIVAQEIMKSPESLAEFYVLVLENGDDVLPDIFSILSKEENYPIMFHCVAGKDRTGILAALVYALVSVDREIIIDDYSKSEHHLKSRKSDLGKYDQKLLLDGALMSPSHSMHYMLEAIDKRYGSVEIFLVQKIGIPQDHIEAVKNILTRANA